MVAPKTGRGWHRLRKQTGLIVLGLLATFGLHAAPADAFADGTAPAQIATETVFGNAQAVGNTLMAFDGEFNFALLPGGSTALIDEVPAQGEVVRAFLFWSGSYEQFAGMDRDVDFTLPDGTRINDLSVDVPQPGESLGSSGCIDRPGFPTSYFYCRREVTQLLQNLGPGGAAGVYGVDGVDADPGEPDDFQRDGKYGGWSLVVVWSDPGTVSVSRDIVIYDGFFGVDEENDPINGFVSSGLSPQFQLTGFEVGSADQAHISIFGLEGDHRLGIPPQNLPGAPFPCNTCADFVELTRPGGMPVRLSDTTNNPGNLFNGSNNTSGAFHPGVDIDTFRIGQSGGGLGVLQPGDNRLSFRIGSGDGRATGAAGSGGEFMMLGYIVLSVESFAPRFSNQTINHLDVTPTTAGVGTTVDITLTLENDGSADATSTVANLLLTPGLFYVPGSTTATCLGGAVADVGTSSPLLSGGLNLGTITNTPFSPSARCVITMQAEVAPGASTPESIRAFVNAPELSMAQQFGPENITITTTEVLDPVKTVQVLSGGDPVPGAVLLYTVRVPVGASAVSNISIEDTVPAGLDTLQLLPLPVGAVDNSDLANGIVRVSGLNAPAAGEAVISFTARIAPGTAPGTVLTNIATIDQPALPAPLDTDPVQTTVTSDVSLVTSSKAMTQLTPGPLGPGSRVRYTITATNAGTSAATNVVVTDDVLAPLVLDVATVSTGGVVAGSTITWTLGSVAPGASVPVTFEATIDAAATDGQPVANTARLTATEVPTAVSVSAPTTSVVSRADLSASTKTVVGGTGGAVSPGETLTYTITVRNDGNVDAAGVTVSDAVSASLEVVPGSITAGGTLAAGTLSWAGLNVAAGDALALSFAATVRPGTANGSTVANTARIQHGANALDVSAPVLTVAALPRVTFTKSVVDLNGAPAQPGDVLEYTLHVENAATAAGAALDVVVRDDDFVAAPAVQNVLLPAGGVSGPSGITFDASTHAALASIAPGAAVDLVFQVELAPVIAAGTLLENTAEATFSVPAVGPTTVLASADIAIQSAPALRVIKDVVAVDGGDVQPGDAVRVTLTVQNEGNAPAANVVLRDPLDARLVFESASQANVGTAAEPAFAIAADVQPGAPAVVSFTARVAAGVPNGTVILNQARGSATGLTDVLSNDAASPADPPEPTPILVEARAVIDQFTLSAVDVSADGVLTAGEQVEYTLSLTNTGSEATQNLVLTSDPLDTNVTFVSADDGVVPSAGRVLSFTLGAVAPGETVVRRFVVAANRPLPHAHDVAAQFTATTSDARVPPEPSDDPATVVPDDATVLRTDSQPNLVVTKTADVATVVPGGTVTYTIRVENTGDRAAENVTLADVFDDAALLSTLTAADGTVSGGTVTFTPATAPALTSIAIDTAVAFTVTAVVQNPLDHLTQILNTAAAALPGEPTVPGQPFLSEQVAVTVISGSDLAATTLESLDSTNAAVTTARPGDAITWRLVVQNAGTAVANDVRVRLDVPAGLTVPGAVAGVLELSSATHAGLSSVAPGDSLVINVSSTLNTPLENGTLIALQAALTDAQSRADDSGFAFASDDPSTGASGDATALSVESQAVLVVEKTVLDASQTEIPVGETVEPGAILEYVIRVNVEGDSPATNLTIRDPLPPGTAFEGSASGGVLFGGEVVFDPSTDGSMGTVQPGESRTQRLRVRVADTAADGTVVPNRAFARAGGTADPAVETASRDARTDSDNSTDVTVRAVPRISLDKAVVTAGGDRVVGPGEVVTYTITARSSGTAAVQGASLVDALPAELTDVVATGGLTNMGGTLSTSLPTLAPGDERVFTISARVSEGVPNGTVIANQAQLSALNLPALVLSSDPDTPDVADATTLVVEALPQLSASTKRVTLVDGAATPGSTVRYDIVLDNTQGRGDGTNVVVTDTLPSALTDVQIVSPPGTVTGGIASWSGLTVPVGETRTLQLTAVIRADATSGTIVSNQAVIEAESVPGVIRTDDPSTPAAGDATQFAVVAPALSLEKAIAVVPAGAPRPGSDVTYTLTLRNTGDGPARNVELRDPVPGVLTELSATSGGVFVGGEMVWTAAALPALTELAPGAAVTVDVRGKVDETTANGTILQNQARATHPAAALPVLSDDPSTPAPLDATVRTVVSDERYGGGLLVTDRDTGAPVLDFVVPGQRLHVAYRAENVGDQVAQAVQLGLRVPSNVLSVVSASDGAIVAPGVVTWNASQTPALARFEPGDTVAFDIDIDVVSPAPDGLLATLRATAQSLTTAAPVTFASVDLPIRSRPDLGASTKTVVDENGGVVEPGDVLTYQLVVQNAGGATARSATLIDPAPAGTSYVDGSLRVAGLPVTDQRGRALVSGVPLGDLAPGQAINVAFQVTVDRTVVRGTRIANHARLLSDGAPEAVSDDPRTPLVHGDATVVVVGGGPRLVVHKWATPARIQAGGETTFVIAVENAGTEPTDALSIRDVIAAPGTYVAGSVTLGGATMTDAADGDPVTVTSAPTGPVLEATWPSLEAGEGLEIAFRVRADSGRQLANQATVLHRGVSVSSDGDLAIAGAQPTIVVVDGERGINVDDAAVSLQDANGARLEPGDTVSGLAQLVNRSSEAVRVTRLALTLNATLDIVDTLLDPRAAFDEATRELRLSAPVELAAGERLTVRFGGRVRDAVLPGELVRVIGEADAETLDGAVTRNQVLEPGQLTVGLLPGTGGLTGRMFFDGGDLDGVYDNERDTIASGFTLRVFQAAGDESPVLTAQSDAQGRMNAIGLPAGDYVADVVSSTGAQFAASLALRVEDGALRTEDIGLLAGGSVYNLDTGEPLSGVEVFLHQDDGDADPEDDPLVDVDDLAPGQQGQRTTAQGMFRFDAPPGRYRVAVRTTDPTVEFPASSRLPLEGALASPFGRVVTVEGDGRITRSPVFADGENTYALRFERTAGGNMLFNNHIPLDTSGANIRLSKTADKKTASLGDIVTWTVRLENRTTRTFSTRDDSALQLVDTLPAGMRLLDGAFRMRRIRGTASADVQNVAVSGREVLRFGAFEAQPGDIIELLYQTAVGPGAEKGIVQNTVAARLASGQVVLAGPVKAPLRIIADALFELGTVRAKVFCDDNGNDWQDPGEAGLPAVRLLVDTGVEAETGPLGRAHFTRLPAGMRQVKIDPRSLPPGVTVPGRGQAVMQMSSGLPAQVRFAARCALAAVGPDAIRVNGDSFAPSGMPPRPLVDVAVRAPHAGPRVLLGGQPVQRVDVDLGLSAADDAPLYTGAGGPTLPMGSDGAIAPLTLRPQVRGDAAISAWRVRVHPASDAPWDAAPVWLFAGQGSPPNRLALAAKDASGAVLEAGRGYLATLIVATDAGDVYTSAWRPFAVQEAVRDAKSVQPASINARGGALFSAQDKATPRLVQFVDERVGPLLAGTTAVRIDVHSDAAAGAGDAAVSRTARQAAAVRALLEKRGVPAERIVTTGHGGKEPVAPNVGRKNRAKNRRVVLSQAPAAVELPVVPAPTGQARLALYTSGGVSEVSEVDDALDALAKVPVGTTLTVVATRANGARTRVVRTMGQNGLRPARASAAADAPRAAMRVDVEAGSAAWDGRTADFAHLQLGLSGAGGGAAVVGKDAQGPLVPFSVTQTEGPWSRWELRVYQREDGAEPRMLRTLSGPGAAPASLSWDGRDGGGQVVLEPALLKSGAFFARLIAETTAGDVALSADLPLKAGDAPAAAPVVLLGAVGEDGALSVDDLAALRAALAPLAGVQSVALTVQTSKKGAKLERRTRASRVGAAVEAALASFGVPGVTVAAPRTSKAKADAAKDAVELAITRGPDAQDAPAVAAAVTANGTALTRGEDGAFTGEVPAYQSGDVTLRVTYAGGARATVHAGRTLDQVTAGRPADVLATLAEAVDFMAADRAAQAEQPGVPGAESVDGGVVAAAPSAESADGGVVAAAPSAESADGGVVAAAPSAESVDGGVVAAAPKVPSPYSGDGPRPPWWPTLDRVPAATLQVALPADGATLGRPVLAVRGTTDPRNTVVVGGKTIVPDPETGAFYARVKLAMDAARKATVRVQVTDPAGSTAHVERTYKVARGGVFVMAMAEGLVGQDGAELDERTANTSVTLGDVFVGGRVSALLEAENTTPAFVDGVRTRVHIDTARAGDDVFQREMLDPDFVYPVFGDGSVERQVATSRWPIYAEVQAGDSTMTVGSVRTRMAPDGLLRYDRSRSGGQLAFVRGWEKGAAVRAKKGDAKADAWRTEVRGFATGGDEVSNHARASLKATGSSNYWLRHGYVVEGSERVAILVRDGVNFSEVARVTLRRDVDYTVRYAEGRIVLKQPLSAVVDAGMLSNLNLSQVAAGHPVFLNVEYDHHDLTPVAGTAAGGWVNQRLFGMLEISGGLVNESRPDGAPDYQLGGIGAKLFKDETTWLKAEWASSQSVDAADYFSWDGGLSWNALGQNPDDGNVTFGSTIFPAERRGQALSIEGQADVGELWGAAKRSQMAHAWFKSTSPGFFADGSRLDQGQTKWGLESTLKLTEADTVLLRYDGVITEVPIAPQVYSETRRLDRQIAQLTYRRQVNNTLRLEGRYGYGFTADSGGFGDANPGNARAFHTNVLAAGAKWQPLKRLKLGLEQEAILSGDTMRLQSWQDHLVTHATASFGLTETIALNASESIRWDGENQTRLGLSWKVNDKSRVYANETFGMSAGRWTSMLAAGGESDLGHGFTTHAEVQQQSAFAGAATRGVVGLSGAWKLPYGFAATAAYERSQTFGGQVNSTAQGQVPPGAFTDGTFAAAPGAFGAGSFQFGGLSRDALSGGLTYKWPGHVQASQRLELRYDDNAESRGGQDRVWLMSMTNLHLRIDDAWAAFARYNAVGVTNLGLGLPEAGYEEGTLGVAYRPVRHDWVSLLGKLSRRVETRPTLTGTGRTETNSTHAFALSPIVELPWAVQLAEKIAIKQARSVIGTLDSGDVYTLLWINRASWHLADTARTLDWFDLGMGLDLALEYRILGGLSTRTFEHGALTELQLVPVEGVRFGLGWNFTRFSDNELDRTDIDRSGFFVRAVGSF